VKKIAYQGVAGSYSEQTARRFFKEEAHFVGLATFVDLFEALSKGEVDGIAIAIENSLIGSIHENVDLLALYDVKIVGEVYTRVEHALLVLPQVSDLREIKKVLSHPKALEQCTRFFAEHPWIEPVVYFDTAGAAEEVRQKSDPSIAAIASAAVAEKLALTPFVRGVEDHPHNYTRFLIVERAPLRKLDGNKCTLIFTLEHRRATLYHALGCVRNLNLTKIDSRPIKGRPLEYLFFVEFEIYGQNEDEINTYLVEMQEVVKSLKLLGCYKAGEKIWMH
jgi:prephenate dehydratase